MASRKNLVLASLVSLVMVLSFGIGLVPMLTVSPDQSAKAAPGASLVAISVDGATPVDASYAMPVGSEQGFGALWLAGDSARALGNGEIEWSLATDGSAALIGGAGDAVVTVRALAPGEAGLYVRTADGHVDVVNLTFYEMKAAEAKELTAVSVTSPEAASRLVIPAAATGALASFTAQVDDPADVQALFYVLDAAATAYATAPPYSVAATDVALGSHSVLARAERVANGVYVDSDPVAFEVIEGGADADGDGLPDDLFGANLLDGDTWSLDVNNGGFDRQVGITPLPGAAGAKAIPLPADGASITIVDPANTEAYVIVSAPAGLVGPGQEALLVVEAADSFAGLLGSTQADALPSEPAAAVQGSRVANVNIVVSEDGGATWSNLDNALLADNPVVVQMGGLAVTENQSAAFFVHPTELVAAGPAVNVVSGEWTKPANGTVVDQFVMSAELTTLGVFYAADLPNSPNISAISNAALGGDASGYSIGGDTLTITVENLQPGATVTIDGVNAPVTNQTANTLTVTVPPAVALLTPAESATVDVRVDAGGDFDALPDAFTYLGPDIQSATATAGSGTDIVITGAGFQDSPGTQVTLAGVALNVIDIAADGTSITARLGNILPAPGPADLVVTNANRYMGTSPGAVTVSQGAPVLTDVFPDVIYNDDQYALNLFGENFAAALAKQALFVGTQVYLSEDATADPAGDTPVAEVKVINSSRIVADVPQGLAPGTWNIYVATVMYNLETGTPEATQFTNTLPVEILDPSQATVDIDAIDPPFGLLAGGNVVTITGTNLRQAVVAYAEYESQVFFGPNEAVIDTNLSTDTQLVVTVPAGEQPGPVDVRVVNHGDPSVGNFAILADGYTYTAPAFDVTPQTGLAATGPQGGPFAPASATYTVTNIGVGPAELSATADVPWLSVDPPTALIPEGASTSVEISFNTDAMLLTPGDYQGIVSIDDGDPQTAVFEFPVDLTVFPAGQPVLGVAPAGDLVSDGPIGGPFDPVSMDYTVTNLGEGSLQWTASVNANWVTLSATSGTLNASASATVTVSINANANSLTEGVHTATILFDDNDPQTDSVVRQVVLAVRQPIPPTLRLEPQTGLASAGPAGGPFLPVSKTWSVYNDGDLPLTWAASITYGQTGLPEWLTLVEAADSVYVGINDNANLLVGSAAGTTYTATLTVTGNGGTATRPIALTVFTPPSITAVLPINVAPPSGGTTVYLRGEFVNPAIPGLNAQNQVFFTVVQGQTNPGSDIPAQSVTLIAPDLLEVVTPVHAEGTFDVYVVSVVEPEGGQIRLTSSLVEFFFAEPSIDISSVDPSEGPIEGGTDVVISGGPFPVAGAALPNAKQVPGAVVFAVADGVYNVFGGNGQVVVDLSLVRDQADALNDPNNGPATITGHITYDPNVLEFSSGARNVLLRNWYDKSMVFNLVEAGKIYFVVANINSFEITTFDNQIPSEPGDPHDPTDQMNPFPLGSVTFNVLTNEATETPVGVVDLAMADSSEPPVLLQSEADPGTVTIVATSAEIELEDITVAETDTTVSIDVDLARSAGAPLDMGPATITVVVDYDETVFQFVSADPGTELIAWGKVAEATDNDPVAGQLTLRVFTDSGVNQAILNALTLATLNFSVLPQADLANAADFVVVDLTMLGTDDADFPGASGVGEVGSITVTQVAEAPLVFFGANEADVTGSTESTIDATTPAGLRRGPVDVYVVDPNQPAPTNYGVLPAGFTYLLPELGVTPGDNYLASGTVNGTEFTPASKAYFVTNIGNGTLNWTASADQSWVLLNGSAAAIQGSTGEGVSDEVMVTIDAAAVIAAQLGVGQHTATITFTNSDDPTQFVTRQVILTLTPAPELVVEPTTAINFVIEAGDPVDLLSGAFTVYNNGSGTLTWTAVANAAWVYLDPAQGQVEATDADGQTVTVTLVAAEVALLGVGTHTANVTFTADGQEEVREVVLTIVPAGTPALNVQEQALLNSTGPQGGPFTPNSVQYTVENVGGGILDYTVTVDAIWIDLTNATGSLIPGQTAAVTVAIDQNEAGLLAPGTYTATVSFDDEDAGTPPIERVVTLTVQSIGESIVVTAPVAGNEFERGDTVTIAWTYEGSVNENLFVDIVLLNNGANPMIIGDDVTNVLGDNTFAWTIPDDLALSRDYTIQVASIDAGGPSGTSGVFSVIDPAFTITEPSTGTSVQQGGTLHVEWIYTELGSAEKAYPLVDIWLLDGNTPATNVPVGNNVPNNPFDIGGTNVADLVLPIDIPLGSYRIVITPADSTAQNLVILATTPEDIVTVTPRKGLNLVALLLGLVAALVGLAGGGGDGGGGGPCFIATAAYGTPMADQIDTLRQFRDMYLLSNPLGTAVADAYYHVSPAIADLVAKSPVLAALVRLILLPVIVVAKLAVSMPMATLAMAVLTSALYALRRHARKSRKA